MDGQSTALPERETEHARLTAQYGWVRAVARNLVRDPSGAEDVTQETLLAALAAPPRDVPDDQRLRAWLGRVAFNLSRLGARQGARRRAREVRVARSEVLPSVTEELESAGTVQALSRAITELPEPYRSVVLMRYFDGLSTAEIAARTESSELAVRKRLWRARNKLRAALDHDPISGRLLAALFSWSQFARLRAPSLGGLAAGLTLVAGVTWWSGKAGRESSELVALRADAASARVELTPFASLPDAAEPTVQPPAPREPLPVRHPLPTGNGPEQRPPSVENDGPHAATVLGFVLDLAGQARAGLQLFDPAAPAELLATSDALGAFELQLRADGVRLAARGEGWATIVPAWLEVASAASPTPIVVAAARDLGAAVYDESGRPIPHARLALRCDESAFARVPYPVRLESALLRTVLGDEQGRCFERDLPRGAGLTLTVSAPGFEPLELDTPALGGEERFFLRALGPEQVVSGRVLRRDGSPAEGARVRLDLASTTTDAQGRYRLPVRHVRPEANLEAHDSDESAGPAELEGFGARLASGLAEADLVLGEEHDPVTGRLVGDGNSGWLLVAYPREHAVLDARGGEVPAALTHSADDGSFAFRLPRGTYDLYALAPEEPRLALREALETRLGLWLVELAPDARSEPVHAQVRTVDGLPLAGARVELGLLLAGTQGPRHVPWKTLTSDARGTVAFARAAGVEHELYVSHPAVGRQTGVLSGRAELLVARPTFLQVAEAEACVVTASVLDGEGHVLGARGPLRTSEQFALRAGCSAVLEIPSDARWLELLAPGAAPVRVPIQPHPGELLQVRP